MKKMKSLYLKFPSVFIGVAAIILGIIFQGHNVAFLVGLAFAIAASTNFPILFDNYLGWINNKWCFFWRHDWAINSNYLGYS